MIRMDETNIKDERLQRLMKAARNVGGTFESDMLEALEKAATEPEFRIKWYRRVRNELIRVCGFYNDLAEVLDGDRIDIFAPGQEALFNRDGCTYAAIWKEWESYDHDIIGVD